MSDWRKQLIEKMAWALAAHDDTTPDPNSEWGNENWHCWIPEARAVLAVAEPVIRELVKNAYYEGWQDSASREYSRQEIQKDWDASEARAALNGGKND